MGKVVFDSIGDLRSRVGEEVFVTDWLQITQDRINAFAEATGDRQWIHVDVEKAPQLRAEPRALSRTGAGRRLGACAFLERYEDIEGGAQLTWRVVVELKGSEKPACVAEALNQLYA